jgi:hypothetical protein
MEEAEWFKERYIPREIVLIKLFPKSAQTRVLLSRKAMFLGEENRASDPNPSASPLTPDLSK